MSVTIRGLTVTSDRAFRVICLTHVFPRHQGDAAAPFVLTWAAALRHAGHDVRVIAPHDQGLDEAGSVAGTPVRWVRYADGPQEVLAYRGEMHRIALRPPFGPPLLGAFVTEMAATLRRAVRRWRPDVIHVHWWLPGAVIARLAGVDVPLVVHLHGTDVGVVENRPYLVRMARWALRPADRIEAVSSDLVQRASTALGVTADAVNPMPLDLAQFDGAPPARMSVSAAVPVILGVGRLIPEKGFRDLVRAVGGLGRPVILRIVGEGPDRAVLADLGRSHGVQLELPGPVAPADLSAEYVAADLVVQPSHGEGFGLVAAEAVLMGCPVVATATGGAWDLLDRRSLVKPGDVGTLRARIVQTLSDPDPSTVARAGDRVRELLSCEHAVARTVHGWQEAIQRHRRQAQ